MFIKLGDTLIAEVSGKLLIKKAELRFEAGFDSLLLFFPVDTLDMLDIDIHQIFI